MTYGYFVPDPESDKREAEFIRRYHIKEFISIYWPIPVWVLIMSLMLWVGIR